MDVQSIPFYRSPREVFKANRDEAMRSQIADTMRSGSMTDVSAKQRARMRLVDEALAAGNGRSLYTKEVIKETPDQGGLDLDRAKARLEALAIHEAGKSQAEFDSKVARWSNKMVPAESRRLQSFVHRSGNDLRLAVPMPEPPKLQDGRANPDYRQCSFCHTWHHKTVCTFGSGPLEKTRVDEIREMPPTMEKYLDTTIVHYTRTLIACPDHCLKIVNTKFPDTKG